MSIYQAVQLFKSLTANLQQEIMHFIEFIAQKNDSNLNSPKSLSEIRKSNFGRLKGKIHMSPDFDDPVEGFEAYICL